MQTSNSINREDFEVVSTWFSIKIRRENIQQQNINIHKIGIFFLTLMVRWAELLLFHQNIFFLFFTDILGLLKVLKQLSGFTNPKSTYDTVNTAISNTYRLTCKCHFYIFFLIVRTRPTHLTTYWVNN